ncbi:MAG: sugar ABC transporter substrate-binding protein [Faecousia sp.]
MKKLVAILLALTLILACFSACSKSEETEKEDGKISIGVSVMTLENAIWAQTCTEIQEQCKAKGWDCTLLDCNSTAETQISQLENFISKGVDVIVVNPTDQAALEGVMKQAMDKGIKVISWDIDTDAADVCLLVSNYEVGYSIGEQAAKWIQANYDGKTEICVLDYPEAGTEVIKRADGIVDALTELVPESTIVARVSHEGSPSGGMAAMESVLQAHPNTRVVCSVGDGGAMGANEAMKAAGLSGSECGIFSADGTQEFLSKIIAGEPCKMSVQLDVPEDKAKVILDACDKLMKGEAIDHYLYTNVLVIDETNAKDYYTAE